SLALELTAYDKSIIDTPNFRVSDFGIKPMPLSYEIIGLSGIQVLRSRRVPLLECTIGLFKMHANPDFLHSSSFMFSFRNKPNS
ncbi:hypothetical protein J6590_101914, partial [Homalodisca vitripennis]